jgi:hypothetical protein
MAANQPIAPAAITATIQKPDVLMLMKNRPLLSRRSDDSRARYSME